MRFLLYFVSFSLCTPSIATALARGLEKDANPQSIAYVTRQESALTKANNFIAQLNLTEKAGMVTGSLGASSGGCTGIILPIERIGFPGLCLQDGPNAVNRVDLESVFPAGITAAATFDKNLIYERYAALGREFKAKGVHVALGPVAGPLGRHPLGGRNWEGFSPDPYLTGVAMNLSVRGMQDMGVQACSKHFIGNEQETQRSNTVLADGTNIDGISSNIDDRTLHELYLWPFQDAIKAGTSSIMCSYNRYNQTYACENSDLLNEVLKTELGFEGYVVSDWFATHSGVKSANNGLDVTMPGVKDQSSIETGDSYFGRSLIEAVNNGSVTMERLDDMIRRFMTPYYLLNQDSDSYPTEDPSTLFVVANMYGISLGNFEPPPARDVRGNHSALIRSMAAAGTVLLKNTNSTLPLLSPMNIGVFGNDAADIADGLTFVNPPDNEYAYDIGTLPIGGGSGSARLSYVISPLDAIKEQAKKTGARVQYILSNRILAGNDLQSIFPTPDVCLVFLKTFATEGFDRTTIENDWNSTLVVNNVAARCPNTVVITHSGGVNTLPWAENPNVTAILAAHYPGEQSGNSIVDVLWGRVNPSAKLPYTIPVTEADYGSPVVNLTNVTTVDGWQSDFTDGLFIDYRHFDSKNITPLYEFGYGLSYTTFDIKAPLTIASLIQGPSEVPDPSLKIVEGGNPDLWTELLHLSSNVSNTGSVAGSTVVQLYFSPAQDSAPPGTPLQVLRGFEKIELQPGEQKVVDFMLNRRDVSYWDTIAQTWRLYKGPLTFSVGFSSRDFKASTVIDAL